MSKKLFVGSLAFSVNDDSLKQMFDEYGTVVSAKVINDRDTGRSRGFGFVEMETSEQAEAAIQALDGSESDGRKIVVNIANERR
ncbi:MAG: RNA-binding protein [Chlamydiia bacterium]|nr:RNA-binding protein [Chlamydiia bacterium]